MLVYCYKGVIVTILIYYISRLDIYIYGIYFYLKRLISFYRIIFSIKRLDKNGKKQLIILMKLNIVENKDITTIDITTIETKDLLIHYVNDYYYKYFISVDLTNDNYKHKDKDRSILNKETLLNYFIFMDKLKEEYIVANNIIEEKVFELTTNYFLIKNNLDKLNKLFNKTSLRKVYKHIYKLVHHNE